MRKVKDAVDLTTNEKIYFKGHAKATYLSDGNNVEDTMEGIAEAVMGIHESVSANYATKQYVQDALDEMLSGEYHAQLEEVLKLCCPLDFSEDFNNDFTIGL